MPHERAALVLFWYGISTRLRPSSTPLFRDRAVFSRSFFESCEPEGEDQYLPGRGEWREASPCAGRKSTPIDAGTGDGNHRRST